MKPMADPFHLHYRAWGTEAPGASVFKLHDGDVYHTYSTFAAGLAELSLVYDRDNMNIDLIFVVLLARGFWGVGTISDHFLCISQPPPNPPPPGPLQPARAV